MTLAGRASVPFNGKARWQPVWRKVHRAALMGRNYGEGEWERSGEPAALRYAKSRIPDALVVVDVGANFGGWALAAEQTWPGAQIHAFEPSVATYRILTDAVRGHRVTPVRAACGAQPGTATLHAVPGLPGLSSLHERDLTEHHLAMTETEEVSVTTLNDYCRERAIGHIDFLKVDAEGHDLAVLQGTQQMIDSGGVSFIQFEFGGANIDSRTYLRDFVRLLTPRYRLSRLLVDGLDPLEYGEVEEVFVTANFLAESI